MIGVIGSKEDARSVFAEVRAFLTEALALTVSEEKAVSARRAMEPPSLDMRSAHIRHANGLSGADKVPSASFVGRRRK
jgi:hypothetical protein